jgi:hypothetical protein
MQKKQKTDLELANEQLQALKPNITSSDRKDCPRSEAIIVQYLKGEGKDLDTAMELLQFFRQKIEDRRKVISNETVVEQESQEKESVR